MCKNTKKSRNNIVYNSIMEEQYYLWPEQKLYTENNAGHIQENENGIFFRRNSLSKETASSKLKSIEEPEQLKLVYPD